MNTTFSCHHAVADRTTARLFPLLAALLAWLAPFDAAFAACSTHRGKVVFNEVYRPASGSGGFVELKILNASVAAATTNFTGWKIDAYSTNVSTRTSADFHAAFTNNTLNTCGTATLWIKVPDTAIGNYLGSRSLPYNFVLSDSAGEIVDVLRLGTSPASFYGAGANYPACPNIEGILPNTQYDAVVSGGGASQKDWYRNPDGSGPWIGSSTSNVFNTVCASNGGVTTPGAFVAYDPTSPACAGPSGNIRTKVAGAYSTYGGGYQLCRWSEGGGAAHQRFQSGPRCESMSERCRGRGNVHCIVGKRLCSQYRHLRDSRGMALRQAAYQLSGDRQCHRRFMLW
jgi:hypothetical protein